MPNEQEEIAEAEAQAEAEVQEEAGKGDEEEITVKKSEYDKVISDRDNYRAGLLKKKADERAIEPKGESGDEGEGKATIDETKVKEIAKAEASAIRSEAYTSNEKRAGQLLLKKYGEYVDDAQYASLMAHFVSRKGKATVEDIMDDFDDAVLLHKKSTGKLDEFLKKQSERARAQGQIEGNLNLGRSAGGAGDRNESSRSTGTISPFGEILARATHTDPEKVKKVDIRRDSVIEKI